MTFYTLETGATARLHANIGTERSLRGNGEKWRFHPFYLSKMDRSPAKFVSTTNLNSAHNPAAVHVSSIYGGWGDFLGNF